ncbi:carbohydrate-binding module family 1 protein [Xylariaceae sp. FL0594]|nr:carbohydrate-binding module family 1 protein [Xylariaceae sp. FL0594]
MKSTFYAALTAAMGAANVAAHATFQDLWVNGVDYGSTCARLPSSNSPITDVTSSAFACNANPSSPAGKCTVAAGSTVTIEMHQQPNDRSCASEAIGGDHHGPIQVYLAPVSDARTAVGSSASWFKIFADTWAKNPSGSNGDADFWGTKDMNKCCGKMNVKIPSDIAPGDYLLRAEALALHVAGSKGGAQFYMTCYQITVTGGGSAKPAGVSFPGAYSATDPGILVDIHAPLATYIAPGPTVYAGGSTKSAGGSCAACEATCAVGSSPTSSAGSGGSGSGTTLTTTVKPTTTPAGPTTTTTSKTTSTPTPTGGSGSGCKANLYEQCGGIGFTGCTSCASGTCKALNDYYSQCS